MTDEQYEQYRSELNRPYSAEELRAHQKDRDAKSLLEITHADNHCLIKLTEKWIAFVNGEGLRPKRNIWKFLVPGNNNENSACDRLNQLVEYYSQFEHDKVPVLPIAFFCSRSTVTLIEKLEELHYSPHLDTADRAAKDFFTFIAGESKVSHSDTPVKAFLKKCIDDFVSACEANAKELHQYLLEIIQGKKHHQPLSKEDVKQIAQEQHEKTRAAIATEGNTTRQEVKADAKKFTLKQDVTLASVAKVGEIIKRIDDRDKRYKRKTKLPFDLSKLDEIYDLWKTGKNNPEIKCGINTRLSYVAVFNFYRRQFIALGVTSAEVLKRAVRIKDRQLRNMASKKK